MKKSWGFFLFPFGTCITVVIYLFFQLEFLNVFSLRSDMFAGKMVLETCPTKSQKTDCSTALPTKLSGDPPTSVQPTSDQLSQTDSGERHNRHATLTALAPVYISTTSTSTALVNETSQPGVPTVESPLTNGATPTLETQSPKSFDNTFIWITLIFVGGIIFAVILLKK